MTSRIRSLAALAVVALATPAVLASHVAPAAAAPAAGDGFTDVLVASALGQVTSFVELPEERMLVAAKTGELWLMGSDGARSAAPVLSLAPCTNSEQGLLGVAADPGFVMNNYFYVYYTRNAGGGSCMNRVSRFTLSGTTAAPASELVLIDNIPSTAGNHNGGDVQIGKDGLLYVSVGDNATSANAQLTTNLHGKILRIALDGSVPNSNPFAANVGAVSCANGSPGTGPCKEIVAWGLRNPFRIAPNVNATGTEFYINDVGANTSEEVDKLTVGSNYGWDVREGFCAKDSRTNCDPQPPGFEPPIHDYAHSTGCGSITGGAFAPSAAWPTKYAGRYLYGDFGCQKIFALVSDGSGGVRQELFVNTAGAVVHLRTIQRTSGWAVYYATLGGELHRVTADLDPGNTDRSTFHPLSPKRVLDTRSGIGYFGRKPAAGETILARVTGSTPGSVPPEAVAVALNLTGTESAANGFITVWPAGEKRRLTSAVNFAGPNDTVANAVIVRLRPGGQINLYAQVGAHLVADVTGYWTETNSSAAGRYVPAPNPARLLDSRAGVGAPAGIVGAGGSLDLQVSGRGGVPSAGISAVALVVTIAEPAAAGFVTVWPTGQAKPLASTLNPTGKGDIRSNLVMLPVGAGGKVSLYTLQATHLVVDVAGWFTDGTATTSSSGLMIAISPLRVTDTREKQPFGRLDGGDTGVLNYAGFFAGATAIATNLTVDGTQSSGFLTAWPADQPRPTASNVNWSGAGQTRAALALSSLAGDGKIAYLPNVGTDFVVDVSAYFVG